MRGIVYTGEDAEVTDKLGIGEPGPTEVKVKIVAAGVCHSDLSVLDGTIPWKAPSVLGHEGAGIVESIGSSVRSVKPGDHVVVATLASCGTCRACNTGHPTMCIRSLGNVSTPFTYKGEPASNFAAASVFAEYTIIQEVQAVPISKDVPFTSACLIGCGVLTGVGSVLNRAKVAPGENVVVIGCGGVGMAAINGAEIAGAGRIIAVDTNPAKLQLATKLGATDIVDPRNGDVVQQVRDLTGGGVHHSFEVLGRKETAEQAFAMLAPGGTATIVGMIPFGQKIELHGFDFLRERKIQGSSMGSNHFRVDMPRLIEFYMRGKLHLEDWISAKLKLSEINEGFAAMKAGKTVRSVIMFDA